MSRIIGLNPTGIDVDPQFGLNQFGPHDDKEFCYVKVNGAIGARGEVVVLDTDGNAYPITTSVDFIGRRCGIAPDAAAIGRYCWVLVRGDAEFFVAANCAAHKSLRATTVGGVVDDAGSGPVIEGMVHATVAAGAMQTLVKGRLVNPTLQEQAAGGGGGGASDFLSLDDTPSAFGTAGQVAAVNTAETALEFVDQSGGGGGRYHGTGPYPARILCPTDESDPNRITHSRLNGIRDIFTCGLTSVLNESASGDPIEYLTPIGGGDPTGRLCSRC